MTHVLTSKPIRTTATREPVRYMARMLTPFEQTAEAVTARVAELLCASISVIDERGIVIASNQPSLIGLPFIQTSHAGADTGPRVPLHCDGQAGEVIVGTPLNGEAISPRLAWALTELVINQTVVNRLPDQHELKNGLIHNLLHGLIDDEVAVQRQAGMLGMDFGPPRAVILIDAAEYILAGASPDWPDLADGQVRRRAQFVISSVVSFFHLPNDTICAYVGNGEVVVLKASDTKNLVLWADRGESAGQSNAAWANLAALRRAGGELLAHLHRDIAASIRIGIGRYHPGIRGLARSYQDARAALALGRRLHDQNRLHCLDRLGMAAFVGIADEQTKVELATYLLSPLDDEPELFATLDTFFATNCCPSSAAGRLSIHRNTLGYRLAKIASLTGLDPRKFDEAVQIRLALLLREMRD